MKINIEDGSAIKSGVCYIIGAGKISNTGWFKRNVHPTAGDYLIAADGGYDICDKCGIHMDLIVGDFDSLGFVPSGSNVVKLPVMKDDTDMLHAIRYGLGMGYRSFQIYGASGGRPDHTMANYQALAFLAKNSACGIICDTDYQVCVIRNDSLMLPAYESGTVSVFTMDEEAKGVSIKGLTYEVEGISLTNDFPLGCSNSFCGKKSTISVENGTLLIMWETV